MTALAVPLALLADPEHDREAELLMRHCRVAQLADRVAAHGGITKDEAREDWHRLARDSARFHVHHYPRAQHVEVTPTAVFVRWHDERILVAGVES